MLQTGLEDGLNTFIFPLPILLAEGKRLALAPLYLDFLFYCESISNIVFIVGLSSSDPCRYIILTNVHQEIFRSMLP